MKILTDQLTATRPTTDATSGDRSSADTDAFASLLAKEVGGQSDQATGLAAPLLTGYGALDLSGIQATDATQTTEDERAAMDNVDSLLGQWEQYADQLATGSGGDSLKKAYGVLENIASGVKQLKDGLAGDANSPLGAMVNELEVMTVTEQYKFNRGDYV